MSRAGRERSGFEISVLVGSILAVALVAGGLVVAKVSGGEGGPDLRATVRATDRLASGGALYEVELRNVGGETAENVVVEISLGGEVREVEVLSIAKGDRELATVVFPQGVSGTPQAVVLSYHVTTRG